MKQQDLNLMMGHAKPTNLVIAVIRWYEERKPEEMEIINSYKAIHVSKIVRKIPKTIYKNPERLCREMIKMKIYKTIEGKRVAVPMLVRPASGYFALPTSYENKIQKPQTLEVFLNGEEAL